MRKRKYKVGDTVRTLADTDADGVKLFSKGTIGIITEIDDEYGMPLYKVNANGDWWYYRDNMIEPVDGDGTSKHEMTNEEAQKTISKMLSVTDLTVRANMTAQMIEACHMAIKALKQEPSRNMEEIAEVMKSDADAETKCKMVSNILTAEPHYFEKQESKTGHRIADVDKWGDVVTTVSGYRCDKCNAFDSDEDNYCPNCGAKMEGVEG